MGRTTPVAERMEKEGSAPLRTADPYNINSRILKQVSELLTQLEEGEHVTLKERFQALASIARIQYIFVNLRKEKADEPERGATVKKYAGAFAAHGAGRPARSARRAKPASDAIADDWFENADRDGDDAA
jgi:hypothetical protein